MRIIRNLFPVGGVLLFCTILSWLPDREMFVVLLLTTLFTSYQRTRDRQFNVVFVVTAVLTVSMAYKLTTPTEPEPIAQNLPDATLTRTPTHFSLEVSSDFMQQKVDGSMRLRQENPEEWRRQMRDRIERLKPAAEGNEDSSP